MVRSLKGNREVHYAVVEHCRKTMNAYNCKNVSTENQKGHEKAGVVEYRMSEKNDQPQLTRLDIWGEAWWREKENTMG